MPKRGSAAFYGDSGTAFNGPAREQIDEYSQGQGHKGNSVDVSQRYAQSEADDFEPPEWALEMAERMTRGLKGEIGWGFLNDQEKRADYISRLAQQLSESFTEDGRLTGARETRPKKAQPQEPEEEPSLSRAADDKFWSDPEEQQKAAKQVRPRKL